MLSEIDLNAMRLPQGSVDDFAGEEVIDKIRVRKPDKQCWFRVHPDADMRIETQLLNWSEDRNWYYIDRGLWSKMSDDLVRVRLVTCIDLRQEVFLWPIKVQSADGKINPWTQSALNAADIAIDKWTRLVSDMGRGKYRITAATAEYGAPGWPELSFSELVNLAFADCFIRDLDHPIVKKLRGVG